MRDQSAFGESSIRWSDLPLEISGRDRNILRALAERVRELAYRPIEEEKAKLWRAHNDLHETRPLIFCDPENGWNEILEPLGCEGELAQMWENRLRKECFWGDRMKDDRVISRFFNVYYAFTDTGWGKSETRVRTTENGSYTWIPALESYDEISALHHPETVVDHAATNRLMDLASDVFDGILEPRLKGLYWWSLGLTYVMVNMRGLERLMVDFYDHPGEVHSMMAFLRDGFLKKIDYLESNDLFTLNNDETYVGSGGFGYTDELPGQGFDGRVKAKDLWGFVESQETVSLSPAMFGEFIFPYQLPLMERFGLTCYGCCEPLHTRWHIIKEAKNIRRVSVSPWADIGSMAEMLGPDYIFSYKPNPAELAVKHPDEKAIRKNLREVIRAAKGCRVEIIMKDNHTLCNNPENITRWCAIAREEAERG